jgi:NAD(P)H-flavin reductase
MTSPVADPSAGPAPAAGPAASWQPPGEDPLRPYPALVRAIEPEASNVATFRLELQDGEEQRRCRAQPGQFNMIYIPGVGEVSISVSTGPEEGPSIGHTIRFVGRVTRAIEQLKPGAVVGMRGPYGRGWPVEQMRDRDVVIVAGGLGLAPLRPAIKVFLAERARFGGLTLLYGARQPRDLLFAAEYSDWERRGMKILITVDCADETWSGRVGVVPVLFNRLQITPERTVVLTCGPEILMRYTVAEAVNRGVPDQDIYYSMERNIQCAVGLCGHCQLGPTFVCKDGPVFSHREFAFFFRQEFI